MMSLKSVLGAACVVLVSAVVSMGASAQNPRVLMDTDLGPLILELDPARAPATVTNFLAYVDRGDYNNTVFHRIVPDFVAQAGITRENGSSIQQRAPVASERGNGLLNRRGTVAMALSALGNQYNYTSATSSFFFNTVDNPELDPDFTVFGRVVSGIENLDAIASTARYVNTTTPIRAPLIRRAVRVSDFPILELHTGAWFDPARSGRGFSVEIADGGGSGAQPLIIVYWYDYFEGEQVWMNGVAQFNWGDSEVEIPLGITRGAQWGADFDPADVERAGDWGTLTVRFESCARGRFSYRSAFGDGELELQRLTRPVGARCSEP
ncbi:MAG: peptidylprolyl isomerase [Aquimonas sp.]|nr:peptidylprolyl isomerase [Aquimonas sp.]